MNRRGFLKRLAMGVASVALAAHLKFGELVPVPLEPVEVEPFISRFDILCGWSKVMPDFAVRIME